MPHRSQDPKDYQHVPRPVAAMAKPFPAGFRTPPHKHERAQLLYATQGVMRVLTEAGGWVVPTLSAVWLPAGMQHEVRMATAVEMRTLYIAPDADPALPVDIRVISVSPLLRALILEAVDEPVEYDVHGRAGLIMRLILEELKHLPAAPLDLPLPREPRLARLCQALLDKPASTYGLEDWATEIGASPRTLARLFQRETGMSFGRWRERARIAEALARLAEGDSVQRVAHALGYDSPSAFSAMFRRRLGQPPQHYLLSQLTAAAS